MHTCVATTGGIAHAAGAQFKRGDRLVNLRNQIVEEQLGRPIGERLRAEPIELEHVGAEVGQVGRVGNRARQSPDQAPLASARVTAARLAGSHRAARPWRTWKLCAALRPERGSGWRAAGARRRGRCRCHLPCRWRDMQEPNGGGLGGGRCESHRPCAPHHVRGTRQGL